MSKLKMIYDVNDYVTDDGSLVENETDYTLLTPSRLKSYFEQIKNIKEKKKKDTLSIDDIKDCDESAVKKLILDSDSPVIGKKIKLVRGILGMSATQMSLDLGYSKPYIKFIEIGQSKPTMTFLKYFCISYGVDYDWLTNESVDSLLVDEIPVGLTQKIKLQFDKLDVNYQLFAIQALKALYNMQKREEQRINNKVDDKVKELLSQLENNENIDKTSLEEIKKIIPTLVNESNKKNDKDY